MLSPFSTHEAVVTETAKWIEKPIERRKDRYEDNQNHLSPEDRRTWEWYKLLNHANPHIALRMSQVAVHVITRRSTHSRFTSLHLSLTHVYPSGDGASVYKYFSSDLSGRTAL
jgi:hypothetical protein